MPELAHRRILRSRTIEARTIIGASRMFAAPLAVALGSDLRGCLRSADRTAMAVAVFVRQESAVIVGRTFGRDRGCVAARAKEHRDHRRVQVARLHLSSSSIASL